MPGTEAAYPPEGEDLYPKDKNEHDKILSWALEAFEASVAARRQHEDRWRRFYQQYRAFVVRQKGDWRSKVFIPVSAWVVETILPRLVAQLPKMLVNPVEETDAEPAKVMEHLMEWAANSAEPELYLEMCKAYKSALIYGTGILQTFHQQKVRTRAQVVTEMVPITETVSQPVIDPDTGFPLESLEDGQPITEDVEVQVGEEEQSSVQRQEVVAYDGPAAEWVDIENFWPAPEGTDPDDSRYVIHRSIRDAKHVQKLVDEGKYKLPDGMTVESLTSIEEDPAQERMADIERGAGVDQDPTRKPIELLHFWTDDRLVTLAQRKVIVQVAENPYDHGEKPFIRIVDHLVPGEFWGIGEIEWLEGLQDLRNALTNQRVDNVRLALDQMFVVNPSKLKDRGQLAKRPGGVIEISGDLPVNDIIQPVVTPDVTGSSYEETERIDNVIERVSGVNDYTMGQNSPDLNDTATGIALISEAGNTRFGHKVRMAELTGFKRLARHFGAIIQQFWPAEKQVRIVGPGGLEEFRPFTWEEVQGALDYNIEAASSTQTESIRQQQSLNLLHELAGLVDPLTGMPMFNIKTLAEDVLASFGKKDFERYFAQPPQMPQMPGMGMPMDPGMEAGFLQSVEAAAPQEIPAA